jgi:adenylate cyclase
MTAIRRLAAILAADVAGYSRLMGADEEGTHERLKDLRRELIDPNIAQHHGRIVKTTGDGILIEFSSVVDALRCATAVQKAMAERNADVPPETRIEFRVGIHQGDIVVDDGDIFGDGVNVAARLESLAHPGGICVSARVQEDATGKLDIKFDDLGEQSLKNIARPVRVYSVSVGAVAPLPEVTTPLQPVGPRPHSKSSRPAVLVAGIVAAIGLGSAVWWAWPKANSPPVPVQASVATSVQRPPAAEAKSAPRLSIVVLPFSNLSNDPEQEYFADGITDDLTSDLSRISGSFVIARTTAFT